MFNKKLVAPKHNHSPEKGIFPLMKCFLSIFLIYWTFGMFLLPMGDFSALKDLPEQYRHCRDTEDKDMTFIDFITDHLINIDCLFDKHGNGDKQKPHSPYQHHHQNFTVSITHKYSTNRLLKPTSSEPEKTFVTIPSDDYSFQFCFTIFHPPIV